MVMKNVFATGDRMPSMGLSSRDGSRKFKILDQTPIKMEPIMLAYPKNHL
jgi:hypothetical protein